MFIFFSRKKKKQSTHYTTETKEEKIKKTNLFIIEITVWNMECRIQKITNASENYDVANIQYDWKIIDNIEFYLILSL